MLEKYLTSGNINTFGLILDIIGVFLIYIYKFPKLSKFDSKKVVWATDPKKDKKNKRWAVVGLILLITGFGLQILSNYPAFLCCLESKLFNVLTFP